MDAPATGSRCKTTDPAVVEKSGREETMALEDIDLLIVRTEFMDNLEVNIWL